MMNKKRNDGIFKRVVKGENEGGLFGLKVTVLKDGTHRLGRKGNTLADGLTFMAKVREYEKKYPFRFKKAVKSAIKYCIDNGILRDYLEQNAPEVIDMLAEFRQDEILGWKRYTPEVMGLGLNWEETKKKAEELLKKNHK